jgi:hypothetical protein
MSTMAEHSGPSSPPVDFPVYGLDASWHGSRWLDYYSAVDQERAWAIGLGHRSAESSSAIVVSTLRQDHYIPVHGETDPLIEVAFQSALRLGDASLPVFDTARPPGMLKALVAHMDQQARRYRDWPVAQWRADGNLITAPVLKFAGGWMTFTDRIPNAYVSMFSFENPLDSSINVTKSVDLKDYGFSHESRLSAELQKESRERYPNAGLNPRDGYHSDLLALIDA